MDYDTLIQAFGLDLLLAESQERITEEIVTVYLWKLSHHFCGRILTSSC